MKITGFVDNLYKNKFIWIEKKHFASSSQFKNINTNNIITLNPNFDVNILFNNIDLLITDYSSVFYNYLLLNRPIAFTEDDIQAYGSNRGFAVDINKFRPGMKLHSKDDICKFALNVLEGKDEFAEKRRKLASEVNIPCKEQYTKRLIDIIGIKN